MRRHVHHAQSIASTSKEDAVYLTCWCGYDQMVGVWFADSVPEGWSKRQWQTLFPALQACLRCWNIDLGIKPIEPKPKRKSRAREFPYGARVRVSVPGQRAFLGTVYSVDKDSRSRQVYVETPRGAGVAYPMRYVRLVAESRPKVTT